MKIGPSCVERLVIAVFTALLISGGSAAGELPMQADSVKAVQRADTARHPQSVNNPENTSPPEQQQRSPQSADSGKTSNRFVSANKVNYFSVNRWHKSSEAQVKFQISMEFPVLRPNLYVFKYNLFPAYVAYTQKSLWNVGQHSMPFEESNYNPEFYLDYPVNAVIIGRFKLRNVVISPIEHESNGLASGQSRSWNRQYILIKFGLESKERLEVMNSFLTDRALLYLRMWNASSYSDETTYLRSIGSSDRFLDYMGRGEIGLRIRNFLWGGSLRDHQLDMKTPIFRDMRKESYEFEFRQQLPKMNCALYVQYWYGYGETLLRFNQFGNRGFVGLSFSY